MTKMLWRVLLFLLCLSQDLMGVQSAVPATHTKVSLLFSHATAKPGETVTAALRLVSEPGWHTYWRNAGDAGVATSIQWQLPPGLAPGSIQWPVPEKLVISKLTDYVYENEILLLIPISVSRGAKSGPARIMGAVEWLECNDKNCFPASGNVTNSFTVGLDSQLSPDAALIEAWRKRLPTVDPSLKLSGKWEVIDPSSRKLLIEWAPKTPPQNPDFYPFEDSAAVEAGTEVLEASSNVVRLAKQVKSSNGMWPAEVLGIVVDGNGDARRGYEARFSVPPLAGDATAKVKPIQAGGSSAPSSILAILVFALLGGIILNVMPCVLPVIALKILGFVNQSREEPRKIRELGLIYMLGVMASFLALAGVILGARKAAGDVNWGMQMQNPYFVVAMLVLVTIVALNLWGVFEITLPGQALGAAGELASREGRSGAFYNGVLATLLATPCTGPFLGAATGAVLTRPSYEVILTFLTIGFGLALPYVLLSWNPRWLKLLPKPGAWMEKFKVAMGFPMAATAIWLWSFGGRHFGKSGGLWLGIFLVFVALALWIYGDFVQRGLRHRGFAMGVALVILGFGYFYTLEAKLNWRRLQLPTSSGDEIANEPGGVQWKRWSHEAVAKARSEGHPVLVDFTADWCFTCQVNKANAIEVESVKAKLDEIGAVALIADFTLKDPMIGAEIRRFDRAGVPLVVVYPADPAADPIMLPDGLFSAGTMLETLERAAAAGKKGK